MPEDKIDTGRAALTFGKEIYPAIDVEHYSRKIEAMATEVGRFVQRYASRGDPESVIRALNTYYYKSWGVRYDNSPESRTKQENNFLVSWDSLERRNPFNCIRYRKCPVSHQNSGSHTM